MYASKPLEIAVKWPALTVSGIDKTERVFPLRRIERIQVSGPVTWGGEALKACAEEGITIHFVKRDGRPLYRMVGCMAKQTDLALLLCRLIQRPDWKTEYDQWCYALNFQNRRDAARRLGLRYSDLEALYKLPGASADLLSKDFNTKHLESSLRWLKSELYGYMTQKLHERGVWENSPLLLIEPIDLAADLSNTLFCLLLIVRDKWLRRHRKTSLQHRDVVTWFAREKEFIEFQTQRLLMRFELWICELD